MMDSKMRAVYLILGLSTALSHTGTFTSHNISESRHENDTHDRNDGDKQPLDDENETVELTDESFHELDSEILLNHLKTFSHDETSPLAFYIQRQRTQNGTFWQTNCLGNGTLCGIDIKGSTTMRLEAKKEKMKDSYSSPELKSCCIDEEVCDKSCNKSMVNNRDEPYFRWQVVPSKPQNDPMSWWDTLLDFICLEWKSLERFLGLTNHTETEDVLSPTDETLVEGKQPLASSEMKGNSKSPRRKRTGFPQTPNDDLYGAGGVLYRIGTYMQHHKFYEIDRRFYTPEHQKQGITKPEPTFMHQFPTPRIRNLHPDLVGPCLEHPLACIYQINLVAIESDVVQDLEEFNNPPSRLVGWLQWLFGGTYDPRTAGYAPFQSHLEQFIFRTTASYFMCHNAIHKKGILRTWETACDPYNTGSWHATDQYEHRCSMFSFCPDPCCGKYFGSTNRFCKFQRDNPCYGNGDNTCRLEHGRNKNFIPLTMNDWNITCNCARDGYNWKMKFQICADADECGQGEDTCDRETELCRNTAGGYFCSCRHGYEYDVTSDSCQPDGFEWKTYAITGDDDNQISAKVSSIYDSYFAGWLEGGSASLRAESSLSVIPCVVMIVTAHLYG